MDLGPHSSKILRRQAMMLAQVIEHRNGSMVGRCDVYGKTGL